MINEEWNKTQNDAPFIAFYDMRAVMFVLPDEMADVSIVGLQWLILITRLNHTGFHKPVDSHSILYLHREKIIGFGTKELPSLQQFLRIMGESSRSSLILVPFLQHAIEKGRGPILYSKKKTPGTCGEHCWKIQKC